MSTYWASQWSKVTGRELPKLDSFLPLPSPFTWHYKVITKSELSSNYFLPSSPWSFYIPEQSLPLIFCHVTPKFLTLICLSTHQTVIKYSFTPLSLSLLNSICKLSTKTKLTRVLLILLKQAHKYLLQPLSSTQQSLNHRQVNTSIFNYSNKMGLSQILKLPAN